MKFKLLLCSLVLFSNALMAQEIMVEGYVITLDGIRLEGTLRLGDEVQRSMFIHFIENDNEKKISSKQLSGYGWGANEYYAIMPLRKKLLGKRKVFMRKVAWGAIEAFEYNYNMSAGIFKDPNITPPKHHYYLQKENALMSVITPDNYKNELMPYISDNKELAKAVRKKRSPYRYKDLLEIIRIYNKEAAQ